MALLALVLVGLVAGGTLATQLAGPWVLWQLRADGPSGCLATKYDGKAQADCVVEEFEQIIDARGLAAGIVRIEHIAAKDPLVYGSCHLALHSVGRDARLGGLAAADLPQRFPDPDVGWSGMCSSAFLHGYMQGMGAREGGLSFAEYGSEAVTTCSLMRDINDRNDCAHAAGHGFSRSARNDLEVASEGCRMLDRQLRNECVTGVVMEVQIAAVADYVELDQDTTLAPARAVDCDVVARDFRAPCIARVFTDTLKAAKGGRALERSVASVCEPERADARSLCFLTAGFAGGVGTTESDMQVAARVLCGAAQTRDSRACWSGYGLRFAYFGLGSKDVEDGWRGCSELESPGDERCAAGMGRGIAISRGTGDPDDACTEAPRALQDACASEVHLYDESVGLG